jgi:hypothetical protein
MASEIQRLTMVYQSLGEPAKSEHEWRIAMRRRFEKKLT